MLATFQEWFHAHRPALETEGFCFEFHRETEQQTVKANNLNLIYGRYEGSITVWEQGDTNISVVDMEADSSVPLEEVTGFVEILCVNSQDLDLALSSFFGMLAGLPSQNGSIQAVMQHY